MRETVKTQKVRGKKLKVSIKKYEKGEPSGNLKLKNTISENLKIQ